jgi:hypothetical protein
MLLCSSAAADGCSGWEIEGSSSPCWPDLHFVSREAMVFSRNIRRNGLRLLVLEALSEVRLGIALYELQIIIELTTRHSDNGALLPPVD